MINVLVIGKGYIGECLAKFLGFARKHEIFTYNISRKDVDYWSYENLYDYFEEKKNEGIEFDFVINCVGFYQNITNYQRSHYFLNTSIPFIIHSICCKFDSNYIHFSSAEIYDLPWQTDEGGWQDPKETMAWMEHHLPDANIIIRNKYKPFANTHYIVENCLKYTPKTFILRIKNVVSETYHLNNKFIKLLPINDFVDKYNQITFIPDLCNFVYEIINCKVPYGVYNMVSNQTFHPSMLLDLTKKHEELLKKNKMNFCPFERYKIHEDLSIKDDISFSKLSNFKVKSFIKLTDINQQTVEEIFLKIIRDKEEFDSYFEFYNESTVHLRNQVKRDGIDNSRFDKEIEHLWIS